jgi:hypothetical protein
MLSLYVDDILLAGNCPNMMNKNKTFLGSKFEIKDIGEASYVHGIGISKDRNLRLSYLD